MQVTRLTLAAALIAATFAAHAASAQSDRRIPTRKGEEPLPTRTDTLIVRDTVRITDTVTVSAPEPAAKATRCLASGRRGVKRPSGGMTSTTVPGRHCASAQRENTPPATGLIAKSISPWLR